MAARDWLIAYGYTLDPDGRYRRHGRKTQVWEELPDGRGWLRFETTDEGEIPEVYKVAAEYRGTSGLHKLHHPGAFDWVYPEEAVANTYRRACEAAEKWAAEAAERKGTPMPEVRRVPDPTPTPEQLASMQNAQAGQAAGAPREETAAEKERKSWWRRS